LADELATVFARASELLLTEETVYRALTLITAAAQAAFPGAAGAGVTLIDKEGWQRTTAASDPVVEAADSCQYELGQGPCLSSWTQAVPILVTDVSADSRWPDWSVAASRLGVASSVSAPLLTGDEVLGAVKAYSCERHAFDPSAVRLLELFAAQATIFITNVQARENARQLSKLLQDALASRESIAAARGVLRARHGIDEDAAMQQLLTESRRSRRALRDVSDELLSSTRLAGR
jgi:GAF domain-containing protein